MDNFCKGAIKFFNAEFTKQDKWLFEQGLTVKDLDNMSEQQYQEINSKWREYNKQQKSAK